MYRWGRFCLFSVLHRRSLCQHKHFSSRADPCLPSVRNRRLRPTQSGCRLGRALEIIDARQNAVCFVRGGGGSCGFWLAMALSQIWPLKLVGGAPLSARSRFRICELKCPVVGPGTLCQKRMVLDGDCWDAQRCRAPLHASFGVELACVHGPCPTVAAMGLHVRIWHITSCV